MPDETPFHDGESLVQERLGVRERVDVVGRRFIRKFMPDQHRSFFELLPTLFVGSADSDGRPWASVLVGEPGFVHSPTKRALLIDGKPLPGDRLADNLMTGVRLGLLGVEFHTRRRNRMNGTVRRLSDAQIGIAVDQSFGNCPKYINARELIAIPGGRESKPASHHDLMTSRAREMLEEADTLFVATSNNKSGPAYRYGIDVSHRGGLAGFVKQTDDGTIWIPDYTGNEFYNTLGNIHEDGRAGLLTFDFANGDIMQLTGEAEIHWDVPDCIDDSRALRAVAIKPRSVTVLPSAFPFEIGKAEISPFLLDQDVAEQV